MDAFFFCFVSVLFVPSLLLDVLVTNFRERVYPGGTSFSSCSLSKPKTKTKVLLMNFLVSETSVICVLNTKLARDTIVLN